MGRHSLPDVRPEPAPGVPARARRRGAAVAVAVVLCVAGVAAAAVQTGLVAFTPTCEARAVRVDVAASPDMAPALRAAARYVRTNDVRTDGRCLEVHVSARESHKVADAVAGRTLDRDIEVWVPDSELWLRRAAAGGSGIPLSAAGNFACTPVTVAAARTTATGLGWPGRSYSWAELATLATTTDRLRLGAADPARSATGLLALSTLGTSVAPRGDDGQTLLAGTAMLLSEHLSPGDGEAVEILDRGAPGSEDGAPAANRGLILSEQAAFTHNLAAGEDLALFHPSDGGPALDYPFTLVDETSMTTDELRAATRFLTLLSEPPGLRILREHGFRTDREPAAALVRRAGGSERQPVRAVAAAPPSAEAVRGTLAMWTIVVQSARLTAVVDASASMAEPVTGRDGSRMDVTKASLQRALSHFTQDDEVGLWEFSTRLAGDRDYEELVPTARLGDSTGSGASQRTLLTRAFAALQPRPDGATGLHDTTLAAYRASLDGYVSGKFNALVVLTDGRNEDPGSISRRTLITRLEELADDKRPVPIVAVAVGPDASRDEVHAIARATGGAGYAVSDPAEIDTVLLRAITAAAAARG
ncbi:substrate-binding domain-containing protein [Streptomyces sp. NPDC060194]|uniref:substrate-binding domain-containing protein n=1 Tax=Streptomyces sp. NPDC060194 TaxID=3347069 RepID=UPI003652D463